MLYATLTPNPRTTQQKLRERAEQGERDLRHWLGKKLARSWYSFIEPSGGSTMGMPDMMVRFPGMAADAMLPVELKVARYWDGKKRVRPFHMRPSQIAWHDKLARSGGKSCILLGVPVGLAGFDCFVQTHCRHEVLATWKLGWRLSDLTMVSAVSPEGVGTVDLDAWKACMALG